MSTTIGAALITAGEETLERAVASVRPHVDQVAIVLTRRVSAEREAEVAGLADSFEANYSWLEPDGFFSNFGAARQRSFDLLETEAGLWIDADDELRGAEVLRELAETIPSGGPGVLKLPYEYERDENGRCATLQWRERVVRPVSAFAWRFRVHECLLPLDGVSSVGESDGVVFVHGKSVGDLSHLARNVRILRSALAEDPDDLRSLFYLGLELFKTEDWAESSALLSRFSEEESASPDERVMALLRLSEIARARGDCPGAMGFASRALSLRPWDGCCFSLARACHALAERTSGAEQRGAWEHAAFWARAGLATPPAKTDLWQSPLDRAGLIDTTLHAALGALGDARGALESVDRALSVLPSEPGLTAMRLVYEAAIGRQEQEEGRRRAETAAARSEHLRRKGLVNRAVRDAVHAEAGVEAPRPEGSLDVVFACGDGIEPWNPTVVEDRGIGGSEQAVVNLARLLSRRGHRVRVFNNCGPRPKFFDGVEYLPTRSIVQAGPADVVVAWRDARALEVVRAPVRLAWAHDTGLQNVTEWRGALVDRVLALSEWHRECLARAHPEIPAEKYYVTRNGVDLSLFDVPPPARDPARMVFSSSPTRGANLLLDMWPEIVRRARERQPTLRTPSLHFFYGTESTVAHAKAVGDVGLLQYVDRLERRMEEMAPLGVVFRGRVSPRDLAREMLSAGCWVYPSWNEMDGGAEPWFETSCIGAMEAQVAGLRVASLAVGALPETVGSNGLLADDDPREGEGRERFLENASLALSGPWMVRREEISRVGRERFSWEPVAADWERLMLALVEDKKREEAA